MLSIQCFLSHTGQVSGLATEPCFQSLMQRQTHYPGLLSLISNSESGDIPGSTPAAECSKMPGQGGDTKCALVTPSPKFQIGQQVRMNSSLQDSRGTLGATCYRHHVTTLFFLGWGTQIETG